MVPTSENNGEVAAALAAGARWREWALVLWRIGRTCGVTVWRRGWVEADWSWSDPWVRVDPDMMETERTTCAALSAAATGDDVYRPALRDLLRAKQPDNDPLATLVDLLELPPRFLTILDAGEGFEQWPNAEHIPAISPTQAWMAATTSVEGRSGWRCVACACYAAGTVLAAAVAAEVGDSWVFCRKSPRLQERTPSAPRQTRRR